MAKKTVARRQELLEQMADYILENGLQAASLRPLAAAAGTSDRMLLHYFADKEDLLAATLKLVATRLVGLLEHAQSQAMPLQQLLPQLALMIKDPQVRPYLRLWLELITAAAGGIEPFTTISKDMLDTFANWINSTLVVPHEAQRAEVGTLALALIEGLVFFDALGDDAKIDAVVAAATKLQLE